MTSLPTAEWFWKTVCVGDPDVCWPWLGSIRGASNPYGRFFINGKSVSAHRFSLLLAKGPPPRNNDHACHSCDNPICVNPNHLWWGTPQENIQDCVDKGRKQFPGRRKIDRKLVSYLRAQGKTLQEIADQVGVNPSSISKALYKIGQGGRIYSNQHRKIVAARAAMEAGE